VNWKWRNKRQLADFADVTNVSSLNLMDGRRIRQAEKVVRWFYFVVALATVLALIWYFIRGKL
jgi:hypothetical protein